MWLRPATVEDAELLLGWRNDPRTRAGSFSVEPTSSEQHLTWLAGVLGDPERVLYIAEDRRGPLGTVRIDTTPPPPEISLTVAPERRGEGFAARIVMAAMALHGPPIAARIRRGNEPSLRAFRRCGYRRTGEAGGSIHLLWTGS